jgi:hypothetical protein
MEAIQPFITIEAPSGIRGLARYVSTIIHGMAVQAAGGATGKELRRVAEIALQALDL